MLADYTTTVSDYQTVKELLVPFFTTMVLTFKATTNDLLVKIMGDRGDGSYNRTAVIESTITAGAPASVKTAIGPYSGLKIMVKPAVAGLNGVLSSVVCFTDVATE